MPPGAPTHLAQAPAWANLSDSPVCSFAACVVQFKDQLCYGFDATGAYSLVIDQTNLLDVTSKRRSKKMVGGEVRAFRTPISCCSSPPAPVRGL